MGTFGEAETYELQFCGDEWYSPAGGGRVPAYPHPEATEVRLWDAAWWVDGDPYQGAFVVGDEPIAVATWDARTGTYECDGSDGWRTYADALEHGSRGREDSADIGAWLREHT